jgi:hypothetical protein
MPPTLVKHVRDLNGPILHSVDHSGSPAAACPEQRDAIRPICIFFHFGRRKKARAASVTKAIFTTKVEPSYDDLPEERYHFPRTYLRQVETAVGDWGVYYEPRRSTLDVGSRGGRQAYFATAHVQRIARDPNREDHFYAFVSDYLEFDRAVPFKDGDLYYESALQRGDGQTNKGRSASQFVGFPSRSTI